MLKRQRMTILVVDDDAAAGRALGRLIEDGGHEAVFLPEADDVMRVIGERPVDVLLSDERMPGLPGSELLAMVARLHPKVFRALMSCSLVSNQAIDAINQSRAQYLLRKPFRIEEVRELLRFAEAERRIHCMQAAAAVEILGNEHFTVQ